MIVVGVVVVLVVVDVGLLLMVVVVVDIFSDDMLEVVLEISDVVFLLVSVVDELVDDSCVK